MSSNWDDSDSEQDVAVAEKPVVLPRTRQPSIAKSLEKAAILESSVAGSVKDSDTVSMVSMISQFSCVYCNIIAEFADVEIFVISLDSLIVECLAHSYHDWTLSGQSIILTKQIDRFLNQFMTFGGKFKLIVFTDFASEFVGDTTLSFSRAVAIAHVSTGPFAKDLIYFTSPIDPNWERFLHDVTPSFLMISTDNVTREACAQDDINVTPQLETIVLDALSHAVPVVLLTSVIVNFSSVFAYYVNPRLCIRYNWESFAAAHWECNTPTHDASQFKSAGELWAAIICDAKRSASVSEHFESLCCAVLLSALVTGKRGATRIYLPEREGAKRGLDVIRDRRLLLTSATAYLEKLDFAVSRYILNGEIPSHRFLGWSNHALIKILPYRIQDDFVRLHTAAALTESIPTDTSDRLFDPLPEVANPLLSLPLLYSVKSPLLDKYIPEMKVAKSEKLIEDGVQPDYVKLLQTVLSWKLRPIEEEFTKTEKITEEWKKKKANRSRQYLSRWYEMFAVEGRGTNLLVDFSRVPKGFAQVAPDSITGSAVKKSGKAWAGQKDYAGGKKGGKEPPKSKKDLILEASKRARDEKIIEGEKNKIKFATQQGRNATTFLQRSYETLELAESRALCAFEILIREGRDLLNRLAGPEHLETRRIEAVKLVGLLKDCFVTHWTYLDPRQKEQVVDLWAALGFEVPPGMKASAEAKMKRLDLGMNMVYYQMEYGGELVDIQSDPKKDDRVTGFAPDAWQRQMLDSVCGSIYTRFRNKNMARGKTLFGTLIQTSSDRSSNALSCQVLVTVPESLEALLLSSSPKVQEFVSHIRYVIFDEVHSIGASPEAHIWEHLLLLIQCPFLALSATIGNVSKLHSWLNNAERSKTGGKRKVDLIVYHERYSELELTIMRPSPLDVIEGDIIQPFMPYGVFMPEKIRMFGIPDDHQLTAKQILALYTTMAAVDEKTKSEFEPCHYYGYKASELFWLSRASLRNLEKELKQRLLQWLTEDEGKMRKVIDVLAKPIEEQLNYRAKPFNKEKLALDNIVRLVDEMNARNMLPALCFIDDRNVCELLAVRLADELETREMVHFKGHYNLQPNEPKRKRDLADKKKKGDKKKKDHENEEVEKEDDDPFAAQRAKLKEVLSKFRVHGRGNSDPDIYDTMVDRMKKGSNEKESTSKLFRLFERGIGFHHAGLNSLERGAVEALYRSGHLGIVFSTSTLALGVNMPCKTVLFGMDTPFLTPLLFRQMSGRAGRRGFDHSGTVCFMSIPTSKMRRLLTASLSTLQGNPPFSTSFIMRVLAYVHAKNTLTEDQSAVISTFAEREKSALSLLQNSFSLFTRREAENGTLQRQLHMYTAYSVQLLRHLQLLDGNVSFFRFQCQNRVILIGTEFSNGRPDISHMFINDELVSPSFEGYSNDSSFIPVIDFDQRDHRGRKIWYNAFAVAFFIHKSRQKLKTMNCISVNNMWYLLHNFISILQRLADGLETVAREQDPVAELVREIYTEYNAKFHSAFDMRNKN
uniref:DEAD/DEAH box helicase n=1 Tax=Angiostrongylus cantonensis TaxID=6313 RepID=A0A158PA69_ANGCA